MKSSPICSQLHVVLYIISEEASMSQSECELDESNVSESQNSQSNIVNQSDDDTDVESIPETSTKQIDAPVDKINSNAGQ